MKLQVWPHLQGMLLLEKTHRLAVVNEQQAADAVECGADRGKENDGDGFL